jgi:hypothetical protein
MSTNTEWNKSCQYTYIDQLYENYQVKTFSLAETEMKSLFSRGHISG